MAGGAGTVTVNSVPDGCILLYVNNEVSLPFTNAHAKNLYVKKDGEDVSSKVIPKIVSGDNNTGFSASLLDYFISEDGSYYPTTWQLRAGEGEQVIDFVFNEAGSSNSIGNIPIGELTFNGVQSVTYNGTDYTKFVVNGTNYPPLPVTISFTIDGTSYQAEEGMTWAEWVASSYNTDGFIKYDTNICTSGGVLITGDDGYVNTQELIVKNCAYEHSNDPALPM